jgi:hypothetical protein
MKIIMEFNLPEDVENLRCAQAGVGACRTLRQTRESLRSKLKYDLKMSDETSAKLRVIYDELCAEMHEIGEDA